MSTAPTGSAPRTDPTPYIIAAIALLVRWAHLAFVWGSDLVRVTIIDSAFYHVWAAQIAKGDVAGEGIFFMSPLYPYLLGLIYAMFGVNTGVALILQGALGAGTVLLLYRWVARRLGPTPAVIAAALAAFYPPFIFYDSTLLTASVILFLSAAILNLADAVFEQPTPTRVIILGGMLGLSALARPLALLLLPVFWWVFHLRERSSVARRFGLLAVGTAIVLLPVSVRNLIVGGEFTLTTSSAGMNFYVGNNPDANGLYWEAPFLSSVEPQFEDEDYRRVASEAVGRRLTTREAGDYWARRAFDWIINDPVAYAKLLGKKALYFWNRTEFANNVSIYLGQALSPVLRFDPLGFWLIAPLGLAGLALLWRRQRAPGAALPVAWVAAYFVGGLIFFVSSEYRLPALLPLLMGAGFLLAELWTRLRAKAIEPALRLLVAALIFLPLVNIRTDFIRRGENPRMDWFNIANTLLKRDNPEAAIPRFEKALAVDPYFAEGMMRLAEAYYRAGKADEAVAVGKRAGLSDPQSILKLVQGGALAEAYSLLGERKLAQAMREFTFAGYDTGAAAAETTRVSRLDAARTAYVAGDMEKSLEHLLAVNAADTLREPALLYNIAFVNWQLGRTDSAEVYAAMALAVDSMNVPSGLLLARIYDAGGRHEEADRLTQRLSPDPPGLEKLLTNVRAEMDSLEAIGLWKPALAAYSRYGRVHSEVAPEDRWRIGRLQYRIGNYDHALQLLAEAEAGMAGDPGITLYQGLALAALGRSGEAATAYQRCLAATPYRVEARVGLARIYLARGQVEQAWRELDAVAHMDILDSTLAANYRALCDTVKSRM